MLVHEERPRPGCLCGSNRCVSKGYSRPLLCLIGGTRRRYRCLDCQRSFTETLGRMNFRFKKADPALSAKILSLHFHGTSNRAIARTLNVSEHAVRIRLWHLARRALQFHHDVTRHLKIKESVCYDGLENFAGSQYDPNNINQLIGRDSLFIYDFNFSSLNRKGYISPWQKKRLAELEREHGRYNPKSVRIATARILARNYRRCETYVMRLLSDQHFHYRHAIRRDLRSVPIEHITISSKACRNFQNILFSVNHADLLVRQRLAAFARETIAFSKRPGQMCQRYALFLVQKNYMLPQFTKRHVRRPKAHLQSPAQHLGLTSRLLNFTDIFSKRSEEASPDMNREWRSFHAGEIPIEHRRHHLFRRT